MALASRRTFLLLLCLGLPLLGGCASGLQYKQVGPTYPPRGTVNDVKIFEKGEPPEPYERLGEIAWDYSRSKFAPPELKEIEGDLRQKAYEVGGDAVVVRKLVQPRTADGKLELAADVVRFKR